MLQIDDAKYLGGYRIRLRFNDGREGVADLEEWLDRTHLKPFRKLRDLDRFGNFKVDYTIQWGEDLDLAPEFLYFLAFRDDPALRKRFEEWGYVEKSSDAA